MSSSNQEKVKLPPKGGSNISNSNLPKKGARKKEIEAGHHGWLTKGNTSWRWLG
jgi:hypothetical protein